MIQVAVLLAGVRTGHSDIARISKDLPTFRPTFVLAVPRVFERIYDTAQRKAAAGGKERIFAMATDTAIAYSQALEKGGASLLLRARRALFDRLVYGKVKAAFGGQLRWAVSGGAPLGARLGHFFRGVGVTVLEGYGLTETTAATTVNTRAGTRIGTVGRPLPGFEVRIADDGVIHVRGGHVFTRLLAQPGGHRRGARRGRLVRHRRPRLVRGRLPDDHRPGQGDPRDLLGQERLAGAAGGRAPRARRWSARPSWSVTRRAGGRRAGHARPRVGRGLAARPPAPADPGRGPRRGPGGARHVQAAVDAANATVSSAEGIKRFRILPVDLTEASGHLTPTLKIKRSVVLSDFAADLEALYAKR